LIKQYVNATNDDVLIFVGSGLLIVILIQSIRSKYIVGSTAAINKLVGVLQLDKEEVRNRTVVFISSFEHHSNILPWKETGIEVCFKFDLDYPFIFIVLL
jgi:selenocysteine lyase/cysteine desulfurase